MAIARALAVEPRALVLDEPTSALDVSVRAEVINLLVRLQDELALSYVFISHDLATVRHLADVIDVMYLGHVVESGPYDDVLGAALHPYTRALAEAVPLPDPAREAKRRLQLSGEAVPTPGALGRDHGLPVPAPLPARRGHLPSRPARAGRAQARPSRRLSCRGDETLAARRRRESDALRGRAHLPASTDARVKEAAMGSRIEWVIGKLPSPRRHRPRSSTRPSLLPGDA